MKAIPADNLRNGGCATFKRRCRFQEMWNKNKLKHGNDSRQAIDWSNIPHDTFALPYSANEYRHPLQVL